MQLVTCSYSRERGVPPVAAVEEIENVDGTAQLVGRGEALAQRARRLLAALVDHVQLATQQQRARLGDCVNGRELVELVDPLLHQRLERLSTFVANSVAAGLDGRMPQCRVPLVVATLTSQARLARLALTTLRQRLAFVQSTALHALQG